MSESIDAASAGVVMLKSLNEVVTKGAAMSGVRHSSANSAVEFFGQVTTFEEALIMISGVIWIPFPVRLTFGVDDVPFFAAGFGDLPTPFLGSAATIVRRARNTRDRMLK